MPWTETCVMDLKVQLISDYLRGFSPTALSAAYGVSRKTVYKWLERYQHDGVEGLKDLSRAPNHCPHKLDEDLAEQIVATKKKHLDWGPKKVLDLLRREYPDVAWPADSTAGDLLKRAGLVKKRRRRKVVPADSTPFAGCHEVNQSWSADFKGDFSLGNKQRCYPLTITDNCSRYLLACRGLSNLRYEEARPWFEVTFREFGLPQSIRTDNGAPFASRSLGGLSRLSKWWIDLGIRAERIRPGRPQQNGRHERMHRSLKDGVCKEPGYSLPRQQERFDRFKVEYNELRSHESLERQTPASQYEPSRRAYPELILAPQYNSDVSVRSVRHNGEIKWKNRLFYVSELLAKEPIGLKQIDEHVWELRYRFHLLGLLNEKTMKVEPVTEWRTSTFEKKL